MTRLSSKVLKLNYTFLIVGSDSFLCKAMVSLLKYKGYQFLSANISKNEEQFLGLKQGSHLHNFCKLSITNENFLSAKNTPSIKNNLQTSDQAKIKELVEWLA